MKKVKSKITPQLMIINQKKAKNGMTWSGAVIEVTDDGALEIYQENDFIYFRPLELLKIKKMLDKALGNKA